MAPHEAAIRFKGTAQTPCALFHLSCNVTRVDANWRVTCTLLACVPFLCGSIRPMLPSWLVSAVPLLGVEEGGPEGSELERLTVTATPSAPPPQI